jgi:hypothetical protein
MTFSKVLCPHRTCTRCKYSKPMTGAVTWPKFVCADCRKKAEAKKAKAA